jgi:hypothetical protein
MSLGSAAGSSARTCSILSSTPDISEVTSPPLVVAGRRVAAGAESAIGLECGDLSFLLNGVDQGAMHPALDSTIAETMRINLNLARQSDMRDEFEASDEGVIPPKE